MCHGCCTVGAQGAETQLKSSDLEASSVQSCQAIHGRTTYADLVSVSVLLLVPGLC